MSLIPLIGLLPTNGLLSVILVRYSLWPCARGNHACLRGDDCAAEMFFSLLYS